MANEYITQKPIREAADEQYLFVMQNIQAAGQSKRATGWVLPDAEPKENSPNLATSGGVKKSILQTAAALEREAMLEDRDNGSARYKMKWCIVDGHPSVEFTKEETKNG